MQRGGWRLEELNGQPVVENVAVTADFAEDGAISGSSGCNRYMGRYTMEDDRLTIKTLVSTMKYCATPGVMEQETAYLRAAEQAASFSIRGERLTVFNDQGAPLLVFAINTDVGKAI